MPSEPNPQGLLFTVDRPEARPATYDQVKKMDPASRDSDAASSFRAAERLQKSGVGGRQRMRVYHALRQFQGLGGCTSAELARKMGVDRMIPARRLIELERAGWVRRSSRRRRCQVSGIESIVWFIVRPWIDKSEASARVPSQRHAGSPTAAPDPLPSGALSPFERRRLREKLAREGDDRTRAFLNSLRGEGASNHGDR